MKILLCGVLFFLCSRALAEVPPWLDPNEYKDGFSICEVEHPNEAELKGRIEVPTSHQTPQGPTFSLYYWSQKKINPKLPFVVFIPGGPGNTAHGTSFDLPDWNVIFFDPRGNTCSRPKDYSTYRDPLFFTSENVARDIDQIRRQLGLEQISIYGVSYGTVPATIYGHLFPEHTRAILLEGVIFEGGPLLIEPQRKHKILQQYFDHLDSPAKDRILELSKKFPTWYSAMGSNILYLDDPLTAMNQVLEFVLNQSDEVVKAFISNFIPQPPKSSSFGFDEMQMGTIGCKELGMNFENLSPSLIFRGADLIPEGKNHYAEFYCKPLGLPLNDRNQLYSALKYPSRAPITYIQGSLDGATSALAAVKHFRSSQGRFKNLILIDKGGHLPAFGALNSGYENRQQTSPRQRLISQALLGRPIAREILEELTTATSMGWRQTQK